MQDAANFHDIEFCDAVDKEVPWLANPCPDPAGGFAAEKEMVGSAILGDFRPLNAASELGILRNLLDRCRYEFRVTPQGLRTEILFGSRQDVGDVTSRLRSEDDFHVLTGRSAQLLSGPRFRSPRRIDGSPS